MLCSLIVSASAAYLACGWCDVFLATDSQLLEIRMLFTSLYLHLAMVICHVQSCQGLLDKPDKPAAMLMEVRNWAHMQLGFTLTKRCTFVQVDSGCYHVAHHWVLVWWD